MSPQPATMSAQQARGLAEHLLAGIEQETATTVRVIEAAEGGKLDYAPDPKAKTAIALIRHIVVVDPWFLNSIANGVFEWQSLDDSEKSGITRAADAAAIYKDSVPAAIARIRALPDAKLLEEIEFFGQKVPAAALPGFMTKHSIHHRGQLSTYLRPMGCKVPGIYGPSADTEH